MTTIRKGRTKVRLFFACGWEKGLISQKDRPLPLAMLENRALRKGIFFEVR